MPKGSITVRFHSVGGWGAITTGKNLAMTLFDLLGYHIKANPKYGSEKKGQPTTYYLSVAPEPIRINCEYFYVDVVLSPDPNVFQHTNALAGLKEGGVFILQSEREHRRRRSGRRSPRVPEDHPRQARSRSSTSTPSRSRAKRRATPSCSCACRASPSRARSSPRRPSWSRRASTTRPLLKAIRDQLEAQVRRQGRASGRGQPARRAARLRRGARGRRTGAVCAAPCRQGRIAGGEPQAAGDGASACPASRAPITDVHRFWEQTGSFYARGMGNDNLTDPFIGLGRDAGVARRSSAT